MSHSNCCFLTFIRIFRRQVKWSGIPIFWRIFQFVVIHTVKAFGVVNKAEVTPQETDPDLPMSVQESLVEAWVKSGLLSLGRARGVGSRGRWEGESGWGIHVNPWLIHVNVWQKPLQYYNVISHQLIKINEKKKKSGLLQDWGHWVGQCMHGTFWRRTPLSSLPPP